MGRYGLLLADADDTLLDFKAAESAAIRVACAAMSIPLDDAQAAQYERINAALWRALERREVTQEALRVLRFERFLQYLGLGMDPVALGDRFVEALSEQTQETQGARAFLQAAAGRVPVFIVTNGIASVQRARFARSPLRAWVRGYVISSELGVAKPDPRVIEHALALAGACADDALMLGDSLTSDIAAANAAGVASCWFNPAGRPNDSPYHPTYEVRSLQEVLAWL